jgi:ComF family protein
VRGDFGTVRCVSCHVLRAIRDTSIVTIRRMGIGRIAARSLDVLFPPSCAACGLPGEGLCSRCRGRVTGLDGFGCAACGHPWEARAQRCAECPPAIDVTRQAVAYDDVAQAVVSALKDDHRRDMALVIADLMLSRIPRPPSGIALVPVPLAASRLRERGFNQAELVARALGERWDMPAAVLLTRDRDGPAQRGSSVTERRLQVRGAFRATGVPAMPAAVCLVDDVITTGATLSACARALRHGGVRAVGAVAFARVVVNARR